MTTNIRKIQLFELSIADKVIEICNKNKINIFINSGTLLGAVRHKGFIPWDDDIDFSMLRKDYNKFLRISKKEFSYPYYVQSSYSDDNFVGGLIHVRRSDTTAILKKNIGKETYNQGVFIDIFPLDAVIENNILLKVIQKKMIYFYKTLLFIKASSNHITANKAKATIKRFIKIFLPSKEFLAKRFEKWASIGENRPHKYVEYLTYINFKRPLRKIKKEWYTNPSNILFEGKNYPCPSDIHNLLTELYGEYQTPKQTGGDHGEIFFDLDRPYTFYLENSEKIDIHI